MDRATVEINVGARILTNRGVAVITELDRHGVYLKDFTGHTYFTAFTQLEAREITAKGVQGLHASLLPWFAQLPEDVQATALFRQECVMEVQTGFRSGLAELAQPGEPFWPFGESYGLSLTKRYEAMSKAISFERSVNRAIMQRVYDGELQSPTVAPRTLLSLDPPMSLSTVGLMPSAG